MDTSSFYHYICDRPLLSFCTSLLCILFTCNFFLTECVNKVGLVIANTLITNHYVWNLVTCCFYEVSVIKLLIDLVLLGLVNHKLYIHSSEQFGLFFIFSILACSIGTSTYCFIRFFGTGKEEILIHPMYGFNGIIVSLFTFARQQLKNESVHALFPQITYHNFPIIFTILQVIIWTIGLSTLSADMAFTFIGLFFSWSYLRFYYKYAEDEPLGDKSDDFSFVNMFPEVINVDHCCSLHYLFLP